MQANSIMWMDGYLLPGSALSDRKKLQSSSLLILYIFVCHVYYNSNSFILFFLLILFFAFVCRQCWSMSFFNFALNVCFFLGIYNLQYRGSSQFFSSVAVYSLRSLPYVCTYVCAHRCVRVRSSLPWHAYLTASLWCSTSTDSSKKIKRWLRRIICW